MKEGRVPAAHRRRLTNFLVAHRLGGREIAILLCDCAGGWNVIPIGDRPGVTLGPDLAEEIIRDSLHTYGRTAYDENSWNDAPEVVSPWDAGLEFTYAASVVAWAVEQVARLYPDLVDDSLHELAHEYDVTVPAVEQHHDDKPRDLSDPVV